MKKTLTSIGLVVTAMAALAQNGAHLEYKMSSDQNMNGTMVAYYLDGNSRSEMQMNIPAMPGGKMNMIYITQKDKPTTHYQLNETAKTYKEIVTTSDDKVKDENQECAVKVLGKEKVGNYNCTHVSITQGKVNYDMWTSKDIPDYANYKPKGQKYMGNAKLYKALEDNQADGFPVKSVYKAQGGREGSVTVELVTFEKKSLSADLFQIPADYKKQESASYTPGTMPSASDIQNMTPEQRQKFVEQMKQMQQNQPVPAGK